MATNGKSTGDRLVGRFTEKTLLKRAKEVVAEKSNASDIFDEEAEQLLPRFKKTELNLGRVLGRGGFCVVNEIQQFKLEPNSPLDAKKNDDDAIIDEEEDEFGELRYDGGILVQDRKFIARRCLRKGKHARYAIKTLSDDCLKDPERFVGGVIDLAVESRFLAVIRHPNIIKMRGVSDGNPYDRGFFVVLDRLYATLTMKIVEWKKDVQKTKGIGKIMDMKGKKKRKVWVDRLIVVYDLSTALEYLHSQKVMYRDLKPDNIGFDVRGDVKIFDFGLAREYPKTGKMANDTYQMSGKTGSLRYMAPEVAKETPYNETVDVYSLAIMAWQIFEMDTPFRGYSIAMHNDLVVEKGGRPKVNPKWGSKLGSWLKKAWSANIPERPSTKECTKVLRDEINVLQDDIEDFSQLDASSRTANSA
eukprot:CAMPEP_0183703874 /NCGR_PEP_ID=MMETSP0737-20130205/1437_1 /TAXON_ID=385413 /ORGANISM="Thalassiosira miniscula, Strain CCMP1093" /LENGTH=416 /DNA_ID=CAMNT_0025930675 /DNA_START=219 /DNA_END=1469 /DNA_ORIENTATION=-